MEQPSSRPALCALAPLLRGGHTLGEGTGAQAASDLVRLRQNSPVPRFINHNWASAAFGLLFW